MGSAMAKLFIPIKQLPDLYEFPNECLNEDENFDLVVTFGGLMQLLFLALAYGYILFYASNLIADGSELLLLIPSIAPIVGSVVLPVLGCVPDSAIILFSGLGDKEKAQEQLQVGVGALGNYINI